MKKNIIILSLILVSCNKSLLNKTFYFVEPYKEWEITLKVKSDSSFIMEDKLGCNKFEYTGSWKDFNLGGFKCFLLNDTHETFYDPERKMYYYKKSSQSTAKFDDDYRFFKFIKFDTVYYSNINKLVLRGMTFRTSNSFSESSLLKKRIKMLRSDYIKKYGRKKFIEIFGEGKSMKIAMKNLVNNDCPHR